MIYILLYSVNIIPTFTFEIHWNGTRAEISYWLLWFENGFLSWETCFSITRGLCRSPYYPVLLKAWNAQENAWPQAVLSLFSYPSFPEPGESPAALLIGGSDNIIITALNGSRLQTLKQLDSNGTHGLDFNHKEESVCWVTFSESSGQLRCARMKKASGFTKEQEVKTVQNLHGMIAKQSCLHWDHAEIKLSIHSFFMGDVRWEMYSCVQFRIRSDILIPIQLKPEFWFHVFKNDTKSNTFIMFHNEIILIYTDYIGHLQKI